MQSSTRFMPSRSRSPVAVNGVGAIGYTPVQAASLMSGSPRWLLLSFRHSETRNTSLPIAAPPRHHRAVTCEGPNAHFRRVSCDRVQLLLADPDQPRQLRTDALLQTGRTPRSRHA